MWPPLPYGAWKETCANVHLWTQIVIAQARATRTMVAPPLR